MKEFFKVKTIEEVLEYRTTFAPMETEKVPLTDAMGRILAEDIHSDIDLPDFPRSIMDGFAVKGASTFGASETKPKELIIGKALRGLKEKMAEACFNGEQQ